jgi:hypothetical protein
MGFTLGVPLERKCGHRKWHEQPQFNVHHHSLLPMSEYVDATPYNGNPATREWQIYPPFSQNGETREAILQNIDPSPYTYSPSANSI